MNKEPKEKLVVIGFWKRLLSDIFDAIILGLFGAAIAFPFREIFNQVGENGLWIGICITFLYTGILQSKIGQGQSLAKKALKIQVLRKDGSYLNLPRSFLRYLVIALLFYNGWIGTVLISMFPALNNQIFRTVYGYSFFILLVNTIFLVVFHPLKRGLHDLIADSIVVRKGEYSKKKLEELSNPKKEKITFGLAIVFSLLFIVGMNYYVHKQTLANPGLIKELTSLSQEIDEKTEFDNVGVTHNWFTDTNNQKTNGLVVHAFLFKKKFDDKKIKLAEVEKAVEIVKKYSLLEECQYINVNVRSGFNIGITTLTVNENFPHTTYGVPHSKISSTLKDLEERLRLSIELGNITKVINDLEEVLEVDPDNLKIRALLAEGYFEAGEIEKAKIEIDKLKQSPDYKPEMIDQEMVGFIEDINKSKTVKEVTGKIHQYGIYRVIDKGTVTENTDIASGREWEGSDMELVESTDQIPLRHNLTFGMDIRVYDPNEKRFLTLDYTLTHPPMRKPTGEMTQGTSYSRQLMCFKGVCEDGAQYEFTESYEMVPGNWRLEYSYKGRTIISKTFNIFEEQEDVKFDKKAEEKEFSLMGEFENNLDGGKGPMLEKIDINKIFESMK